MKKFTYKLLYQEYRLNKQSCRQIAKKYNCNHKTILKYLRIFDISIRSNSEARTLIHKPYMDKNFLEEEYQDKTTTQIAKELEVCPVTIQEWMRKFGIPIRDIHKCRMGKFHPLFKGNPFVRDGYLMIYSPDNPRCKKKKGNYLAEHILIMEKSLGRYLTSSEEVHHQDGNRLNNSLTNLKLFSSSSEHIKYEMKVRDFAKQLLFGDIPVSNKSELLKLFNDYFNEH